MISIGEEVVFINFLQMAAARTGQLINIASLARDAGISMQLAKKWLNVLQASNIIYMLQPYHNNLNQRLIKTPKLYFYDTGLCSYLTAWNNPEALEAGAMSGAILETWAITEILKSYIHNGRNPQIYFYRNKDMQEIDLLIYENGIFHPIEIKKTASPRLTDIKQFKSLEKDGLKAGTGSIICFVKEPIPLSREVLALPINYI